MQRRRRLKQFHRGAPLRAQADDTTGGSTDQKRSPIVIHVANPTSFGGRGSIIILELSDEGSAKKVAQLIADETGRGVTVRNADMTLIHTIPAASTH